MKLFFAVLFRTTRNLHSHLHEGPVTKKHFQVTGYGTVSTPMTRHSALHLYQILTVCHVSTFLLVLRMAQATPMTSGRWRCQGVRRVIWSKCYAAKSVLSTERPVVCFTPPARLCPSGKFTSCLLEMLICTSQEVKICVFIGAGNRGRWPVAPIWKRLQTLSGTSRTMSILNVPATHCLHFCNCCYFRKSNTCLCFVAVPNISLSVLKPTFLEILLESHIVMIRVRKKITHLSLPEKLLSGIISWQI